MADIRCPICDEPAHPDHRPFCSARHRDRDLLQWLNGSYRVPGPAATQDGLDKGEQPD